MLTGRLRRRATIAPGALTLAALTRGAVGIIRTPGRPLSLIFDRVSANVTLRYTIGGEEITPAIDGVDTTRARGRRAHGPRWAGVDGRDVAEGVRRVRICVAFRDC